MISCITAVMNREENLAKMLPTWTKVDKIKDFVIVDWSSRNPIINNSVIQEQMAKYKNIKVIRVEGQTYYYRSEPFNLANSYTDQDNKILLKLDVDYMSIDDSWLNFQATSNNELLNYFICGDAIFNPESEGFLFVNKRNFNEVNGYNENLLPMYAYEDEDIKLRLSKLKGLRFRGAWAHELVNPEFMKISFFDFNKYIHHIPHSNSMRVENSIKLKDEVYSQSFLNQDRVYSNPAMKKQAKINRELSIKKPVWQQKKYKTLEQIDNYIRVEMIQDNI
jgi:hypothetical protein